MGPIHPGEPTHPSRVAPRVGGQYAWRPGAGHGRATGAAPRTSTDPRRRMTDSTTGEPGAEPAAIEPPAAQPPAIEPPAADPVPAPRPPATPFGDLGAPGAAVTTRTGSWLAGLDPRGWRTTIVAGVLMIGTVVTANLVNAAVPLPEEPAAIVDPLPAIPGDGSPPIEPAPGEAADPGPVGPGAAVGWGRRRALPARRLDGRVVRARGRRAPEGRRRPRRARHPVRGGSRGARRAATRRHSSRPDSLRRRAAERGRSGTGSAPSSSAGSGSSTAGSTTGSSRRCVASGSGMVLNVVARRASSGAWPRISRHRRDAPDHRGGEDAPAAPPGDGVTAGRRVGAR